MSGACTCGFPGLFFLEVLRGPFYATHHLWPESLKAKFVSCSTSGHKSRIDFIEDSHDPADLVDGWVRTLHAAL